MSVPLFHGSGVFLLLKRSLSFQICRLNKNICFICSSLCTFVYDVSLSYPCLSYKFKVQISGTGKFFCLRCGIFIHVLFTFRSQSSKCLHRVGVSKVITHGFVVLWLPLYSSKNCLITGIQPVHRRSGLTQGDPPVIGCRQAVGQYVESVLPQQFFTLFKKKQVLKASPA